MQNSLKAGVRVEIRKCIVDQSPNSLSACSIYYSPYTDLAVLKLTKQLNKINKENNSVLQQLNPNNTKMVIKTFSTYKEHSYNFTVNTLTHRQIIKSSPHMHM